MLSHRRRFNVEGTFTEQQVQHVRDPPRTEAWLFPINRSASSLRQSCRGDQLQNASLPRSCPTWSSFTLLWMHRFRLVKWRRCRSSRSIFTMSILDCSWIPIKLRYYILRYQKLNINWLDLTRGVSFVLRIGLVLYGGAGSGVVRKGWFRFLAGVRKKCTKPGLSVFVSWGWFILLVFCVADVYIALVPCFWLLVAVQSMAVTKSSLKWPVMCRVGYWPPSPALKKYLLAGLQ